MYLCICVFVYVCICVPIPPIPGMCICVVHDDIYSDSMISLHSFIHVCVYVRTYRMVSLHSFIHVCLYPCMYVHMYGIAWFHSIHLFGFYNVSEILSQEAAPRPTIGPRTLKDRYYEILTSKGWSWIPSKCLAQQFSIFWKKLSDPFLKA